LKEGKSHESDGGVLVSTGSNVWFDEDDDAAFPSEIQESGSRTISTLTADEEKVAVRRCYFYAAALLFVWCVPFVSWFAFVVPVAYRQTRGKQSAWVKAQTTELLNFTLTFAGIWALLCLIAAALSAVTAGIGGLFVVPIIIAWHIYSFVVIYKGGRVARNGENYRFRFSFRPITVEMP
jgi:uncharacterized Tic20 family protein